MTPKRTDLTQKGIVETLRKLGAFVVHLHTVGRGTPDLLVLYRGVYFLAECKSGFLGWKLTEAQKDFHREVRDRGGEVVIFDGPESVTLWASRVNRAVKRAINQ